MKIDLKLQQKSLEIEKSTLKIFFFRVEGGGKPSEQGTARNTWHAPDPHSNQHAKFKKSCQTTPPPPMANPACAISFKNEFGICIITISLIR